MKNDFFLPGGTACLSEISEFVRPDHGGLLRI